MLPTFLAAPVIGIGAAISAAASSLIAFFATIFTARVALVTTAVAVITLLTVGMIAAIEALAGSISSALPAQAVTFASAVLPTNLGPCISIIASARIILWIYHRNVEVVKMLVK